MKKKEVFWGLLLILAAVLIIVDQFGLFTGVSMFEIIATVILGGIIIKSIQKINFWGVLFPLALICIMYADEWNITKFTPWPALLTALLCSMGLSIMFHRSYTWGGNYSHHGYSHHDHAFSGKVVSEQNDNVINCSTSFGTSIKYVKSENFERADIKCSFGEVKVYFDNALIPSGKADIYLDVSFGEAVLYIPKNWKIINNVQVFLGDMEHRSGDIDVNSPEVTIHGNISFGDTKVIFV